MDLPAAETLAHALMSEHGLHPEWTFAFDSATRRIGVCNYRARRLSISRHFTEHASEDQVRDTLLHEIAHALTPGAKHGLRWKAMAQRLGATPKACGRNPFQGSEGQVGKRLGAVAGKPYFRVNSPQYRDTRWRILRENPTTYSLVADDGSELRASKTLVYPDGQSPPTRQEARQAEYRRNLEAVAGAPTVTVDHRFYDGERFAILRRGSRRSRHTLVNLKNGQAVKVPPTLVKHEPALRALESMPG